MQAIASSLFRIIRFPHQGKIVTVDQLAFFASSSEGNIPFVEHTSKSYESLGAGLFKDPSLMGVFPLPPPNVASINMITIRSDPWILPPTDQVESWGNEMQLSPAELNYVKIVAASAPSPEPAPPSKVPDSYAPSPWLGDETSVSAWNWPQAEKGKIQGNIKPLSLVASPTGTGEGSLRVYLGKRFSKG